MLWGEEMRTASVIEKWYIQLGFNSKYDEEFYAALNTIEIPADTSIANYDLECADGKKNLLAFLYMCDALEKKYAQYGISNEILLDTLSDIVRWCDVWSDIKGDLYLGEISWLSRSMNFNLFQLGRLQYCIHEVTEKFTGYGMKLGESFIGVHIPSIGPLRAEEVCASLDTAREFLAKYFPQVEYSYFSCLSWLLDDTLKEMLPQDSNILKFAEMFTIVDNMPSDSILHYVFGCNVKRENIDCQQCKSSFARKVKSAVQEGRVFYQPRGLIAK